MNDDLISRKAAINTVFSMCCRWDTDDPNDLKNMLLTAFQDLPSAQQEQRWIPVTERLPKEERKHYWVCTDSGYQRECRWTNNIYGLGASDNWGWSIFDIPQYSKVVAWMPLPEPWKGKEDV